MTLYKLTNANGYTRNDTKWGENVTHRATGKPRQDLCSNGYIHAYTDPLLAVVFNSIHANFDEPQLWEARGKIAKSDGLKVGCRSLTTLRRLPLPVITPNQHVHFAILCAKQVCTDVVWNRWADAWLTGVDRTNAAAYAARAAAYAAAYAAESKPATPFATLIRQALAAEKALTATKELAK